MNRHYAIVDGAGLPELQQMAMHFDARIHCLLPGEQTPLTRRRAPHLVPLSSPADAMTCWLLGCFGERPVGICCESSRGRHLVQVQLRRLLTVRTPEGRGVFFRYFDPQVFALLVPTFDQQQLRELFGPVQAWYLPDPHGRHRQRYVLRRGALVVQQDPWPRSGQLSWPLPAESLP